MSVISNPHGLSAIDDYHIIRELGRGGMGVVYEVIETKLSRRVALKVLPRAAALDARQLIRFQNEAQSAARLDHAHIVPVYSVGCQDGMHFYAMKYIEGCSLAEIIAGRQRCTTAVEGLDIPTHPGVSSPANDSKATRRSSEQNNTTGTNSSTIVGETPLCHLPSKLEFFHAAARLGIQAAEALDHAHSSGVTHGDVKPANLLVDVRGHLWLTDFGLARSTSELPNSTTAAPSGTLRYLSPEQARSEYKQCGHRTDIYSLGATLFELITLTPAKSGDNLSQTLDEIAFGVVPLAKDYNPAVPFDLQAILCQAMARDPNDRYSTARGLAEDLQRFLSGQPVRALAVADPEPHRRSRRRVALLASAIVASLFLLVSLLVLVPTTPKLRTASRLTPAEQALLSLRALNETHLVQLSSLMARGGQITEEDRRLLQDGPQIHDPLLVKQRVSVGVEPVQEQYQFELAAVYFQLSEIHRRMDEHELQGQMLQRSTDLLEQLAGRSTVTAYVPLAFATLALAEVHAATGGNEKAIELGIGAITRLEAIRKADFENPDCTIALACLHSRFGQALGHVLPPKEVEQHHRTALSLLEPLAQHVRPWRSNLFFRFQNLEDALAESRVNVALSLEPSEESRKVLEAALEYLTKQADPVPEWRTNLLAHAERNLGNLLCELGQNPEAQHHLQRSIGLFAGLTAEFPGVVEYRYGLATAESSLGKAYSLNDKPSEADKQFQQAIDRLQDLVDCYPSVADYRHRLAGCMNNSAHALSAADSVVRYELALQHQLAAIRMNPQHRQYHRFASIQYSNLAKKLAELKDVKHAAKQLSNAIEQRKLVIAQGSLRYQDKHALGHYLNQLSTFLSDDGRIDEAEKTDREGIELSRSLVDQFERKSCDLSTLGSTLHHLALTLHSRGEKEKARDLLEEALVVQQEAVRSEPENASFRELLKRHETSLEGLGATSEVP